MFPMLNVDISNIWCSVALPQLLESEQAVALAHAALTDGPEADFLAWLGGDLGPELDRVEETAKRIGETAQVLVVVGDDTAVLAARALLELLGGRGGVQVLFAGTSFSTAAWQRLCEQLEGRDFCVQIVGRGTLALQSAVTVRALRWLLERRYGTEKARERVFIVTDPEKGVLRQLSAAEGYAAFNLPGTLGGYASALAPAALLCLAAAGADIRGILAGAASAAAAMDARSFENPAWLYAAARKILAARGKRVEYLVTAEPAAWTLGRWWQRLFAARGCLGGDGLIPAAAEIPADLQRLHGILCDGASPVLQTILRFDPPAQRVPVEMDWKNLDDLNYLEGYTLDYVQEQAVAGAIQAGADEDVPILTVECGPLSPAALGELVYFFELSSGLAAGLLGRDLYEAEPPAAWEQRMKALLARREG